MIQNENTYYIGFHRNVREMGAIPALVFDTICGLLRDPENETGYISNSTLCNLLDITAQGLRKIISRLIADGYLEKNTAIGRGNKTTYILTEKGKQSCPFYEQIKGKRGFQKRETWFPKKGNVVSPLNTELNKELKESDGDMREAQSHTLSNTTPKDFDIMKDFNEFWELYPEAKEFPAERKNCERVWFGMCEEWKQKLLNQLRNGLRWRKKEHDNPYWYLQNYNGEEVEGELPYMEQGTAKFGKWIAEAERKNVPVDLVKIKIGDNQKFVYCLHEDLETMIAAGAEFVRKHVPYRD
jgi:predicted transcriptional regulator